MSHPSPMPDSSQKVAQTIHDLLPIPAGTKQPHAYQVFGLEVGEQNPETIKAAVQATIQRLKSAQTTVDPKLWAQAAKLVQQARQILSDPNVKAQLDARFGIVQVPADAVPPAPAPAATAADESRPIDPLASVLPTADPLSPVTLPPPGAVPPPPGFPTPPSNPTAGDEAAAPIPGAAAVEPLASSVKGAPLPPGAFGTPTDEASLPQAAMPGVQIKEPAPAKRRRSGGGTWLLAFFTLGMLVLIGMLSYFLYFGPGAIAITSSDGGVTISTGPPPADAGTIEINEQRASQPKDRPKPKPRPFDPVMGELAGNVPPPPSGEDIEVEPQAGSAETMFPDLENDPDSPMPEPPAMEGPSTDTPPTELTDEMIAAADQQLEQVRQLILAAKWAEMKSTAEKLTAAPMTAEQKATAEALHEVADLAAYYRGGIERGVESLEVGNDFEVTESFRVIVVEKGEDLLVIRYDTKNKSYTFDELPLRLAHKLASFAMPADAPTTEAAKAVYQALAPVSNEGYREEALKSLSEITEEVEGADPKRLAETLRSLFAG